MVQMSICEKSSSFLQSPWENKMGEQYALIQEGRQMGQKKVRFIGEIVKIERYFSKNK